jgi:hypothetical protein
VTTSKIRLTYYNSMLWQTMLLPDGARAVRAYRMGRRLAGATTRYYRRPSEHAFGGR